MISVPKSISRRSSDWKSIKRKAFLDNLDLKRNYKMYSPKRYPPAGARDQSSLPCSCWDFPRICGEKDFYDLAIGNVPGPPPHTRGKAVPRLPAPPVCRITPAYAGKSSLGFGRTYPDWDHPRIRGEKVRRELRDGCKLGSPPHTRGKACRPQRDQAEPGITPAYAGKR